MERIAVDMSKESDGLEIVSISTTETFIDKRDEHLAGAYQLLPGQMEGEIYVCDGAATWDTGQTTGITISWRLGANGNEWVHYKGYPLN